MDNKIQFDLGALSSPSNYTEPLNIEGVSKETLKSQLKMMMIIRFVEDSIASWIIEGLIKCPCHLATGEEAVAVGVSRHLKKTDRVFGAHRSHAHYLAVGGSIEGLFAEVLGKSTGCSKGMGGSMHLYAKDDGFMGSVPIVSGTVPIAVGAALAAKMDGGSDVSVSYFGDGASEEGVVHESMNLASIQQLPILFVCENNFYSSHMDIKLRQASDVVSRFAKANKIPSIVVDGNDVVVVSSATEELLGDVRAGKGPVFLEAITYRWKGHVGSDENIDVGLRRKAEDLIAWKKRDPIRRLYDAMVSAEYIDLEQFENEKNLIQGAIKKAMEKAMQAPYPEKNALLDLVFSTGKK